MDLANKEEKLLFKFSPVNLNLIRLLVNKSIWFSAFKNLNDPYEGKLLIEEMEFPEDRILMKFYQTRNSFQLPESRARKRIEQIKKKPSLFYNDLLKDLNNAYFNRLKVACFSLIYDEILLWSHYADEHKGVCLIYEKDIDFKMPDYPAIEDYPLPGKLNYEIRNKIQVSFIEDETIALEIMNYENVIFNKLKSWTYESEYRFALMESFMTGTDGFPVEFKQDSLRGIIFGEKCSLNNIRFIHSILDNYEYINSEFFWGASRIVPSAGKMVSIEEYGEIEIEDFIKKRNNWKFKSDY